jgi:hypothetical protein
MKTLEFAALSVAALTICAVRIALAGIAFIFLMVSDGVMAISDALLLKRATDCLRERLRVLAE